MKFVFEAKTNISPEKIWEFYENIEKWYAWEDDLEGITLNGGFITGSKGTMTLKGMPTLEYDLTEVTKNRSFCDKTIIPNMGSVYFNHELIPVEKETIIHHSVEFISDSGEDIPEYIGFVSKIFSDVPTSVFSLIKAANGKI